MNPGPRKKISNWVSQLLRPALKQTVGKVDQQRIALIGRQCGCDRFECHLKRWLSHLWCMEKFWCTGSSSMQGSLRGTRTTPEQCVISAKSCMLDFPPPKYLEIAPITSLTCSSTSFPLPYGCILLTSTHSRLPTYLLPCFI